MKRPSNDAWREEQKCGPFFVLFTVHDDDPADVRVEWRLCPDNEDKCDERTLAGSDGDIRGTKDQLDEMITRAMHQAREAAKRIACSILTWAAEDP